MSKQKTLSEATADLDFALLVGDKFSEKLSSTQRLVDELTDSFKKELNQKNEEIRILKERLSKYEKQS